MFCRQKKHNCLPTLTEVNKSEKTVCLTVRTVQTKIDIRSTRLRHSPAVPNSCSWLSFRYQSDIFTSWTVEEVCVSSLCQNALYSLLARGGVIKLRPQLTGPHSSSDKSIDLGHTFQRRRIQSSSVNAVQYLQIMMTDVWAPISVNALSDNCYHTVC